MTADEKERMSGLLKQVDLQQQEIAMHKLELKVLRDQISKLLGERKALLGEDLSLLPSELEGTWTSPVATPNMLDFAGNVQCDLGILRSIAVKDPVNVEDL